MKLDIKSQKGQSLIELLILMGVMIIILTGGIFAYENFANVQGNIVGCTRYVNLVDSIKDDSKRPVEFKKAFVSLSDHKSWEKESLSVCNLNIEKSWEVKSTISVSLAQAKEDYSTKTLNPIKPIVTEQEKAKTDSEGGFSGWWIVFLAIFVGFGVISFVESPSSKADTNKEDEKKFKALKETVRKEKEKEKENIKTTKKIYI